MTRSIRLVVVASSSVLSADDETKTIRKKHESSLLEVFSDAGSTPAASTNSLSIVYTVTRQTAIVSDVGSSTRGDIGDAE